LATFGALAAMPALDPPRTALVSLTDRTGAAYIAHTLTLSLGFRLLATGGTLDFLRSLKPPIPAEQLVSVAEYTGQREILGGRVKTLHPRIFGGVLGAGVFSSSEGGEQDGEKPAASEQLAELLEAGIGPIDAVVCNLYAFRGGEGADTKFEDVIESIDIGGCALIRAAAKNCAHVAVLTGKAQYDDFCREAELNLALEHPTEQGQTAVPQDRALVSLATRRRLAAKAFAYTAAYDARVASWFSGAVAEGEGDGDGDAATTATPSSESPATVSLTLERRFPLKYGLNPTDTPAALYTQRGMPMPFAVRSGAPGYINVLDALAAWSLVREARDALLALTQEEEEEEEEKRNTAAAGEAESANFFSNRPSNDIVVAASFKHTSPAGAAVSGPVLPSDKLRYKSVTEWTPCASAYVRARQADPKSSYGDFVAISGVVDVMAARALASDVSDGVIAAGFEPDALDILRGKKGGAFIVLQGSEEDKKDADAGFDLRGVGGVILRQRRVLIPALGDAEKTGARVATRVQPTREAWADLALAAATARHTQSNAVVLCAGGQVVGVGAGQQSRVDCVRLARQKAEVFRVRQHPRAVALPFKKAGVTRTQRVNACVAFAEGDLVEGSAEHTAWLGNFDYDKSDSSESRDKDSNSDSAPLDFLTGDERRAWLAAWRGVAMASDGFFPFRDSLDQASRIGVESVVQPGGSNADESVTAAADELGMAMVLSGVRLFEH
jgi:phosphoribosylaminoimidazolecarboxamide formyltransferase / IMP cyclohydrolase